MAADNGKPVGSYDGTTEPCAVVLFGASGDLAKRKVIPAMFDLAVHQSLGSRYAIVGFSRTPMSDEDFRSSLGEAAKSISEVGPIDPKQWDAFAANLHYSQGEYDDTESYARLAKTLANLEASKKLGGNRLFYLSTPPEVYPHIVEQLGKSGLARPKDPNSWVRIIIEKPFGRDLASAKELNKKVLCVFEEQQVYRIDHYLGKDTVQNLLVTRFANGIFEPLWNRNYVHRIEITSAENMGVGERGGYYDSAGALRDMVQNHMLQMVGLTAMEPPSSLDADAIRNEVLKVFQSFQPIKEEDVPLQVI